MIRSELPNQRSNWISTYTLLTTVSTNRLSQLQVNKLIEAQHII